MRHEPAELNAVEAVVIGASAGAITALSIILPRLEPGFPLPIFVVVHQPADKINPMANLFQSKCGIAVKEAEDKEPIAGGTVYFAPADYHLLVEPSRVLSLSNEELVNFSRPAIDVLFESAADVYGPALLGIVLTGANQDGAKGLARVCANEGAAIVQSPATAEARMMPEAAMAACPSARVLSLEQIAETICGLGRTIHE